MEVHGGVGRDDVIDFSISVNPYVPEWRYNLFGECAKRAVRYNHVEWIESEFRARFGEDTVIVAGATEAFQIVGFTLMKGADVVIPMPSYGEFRRVASFCSAGVHMVWSLDGLENAFLTAEKLVRNGKKVVVIFSNPNNPTGKVIQTGFREWISRLEEVGAVVIIDEAFMDFVKDYEDIGTSKTIRIRSFTKSYGMPGIRVGYVKSDKYCELFRRYRAPWGIGVSGFLFLKYLFEDNGKFLEWSLPLIWRERERFLDFGLQTDANFGVIKVGEASKVQRVLDGLGVHVRDCSSFGLPDMIRVSIRKKEENDKLFVAFERAGIPRLGRGERD
ncbi:MAG: aminotransferase class I/II-fold pyridoxal phosphate-dependent enzyme [Synergistetes bacterium]|nr:aminotransferase class I/II-fold pyridoxal phosphate-dependent enzyme [Synergistota bacterium]